jgi:hypothetical protein
MKEILTYEHLVHPQGMLLVSFMTFPMNNNKRSFRYDDSIDFCFYEDVHYVFTFQFRLYSTASFRIVIRHFIKLFEPGLIHIITQH